MVLRDVRHKKQFCGEKIHLYVVNGNKKVDVFQNWAYLIPICLNERRVINMSRELSSDWVSIEIEGGTDEKCTDINPGGIGDC